MEEGGRDEDVPFAEAFYHEPDHDAEHDDPASDVKSEGRDFVRVDCGHLKYLKDREENGDHGVHEVFECFGREKAPDDGPYEVDVRDAEDDVLDPLAGPFDPEEDVDDYDHEREDDLGRDLAPVLEVTVEARREEKYHGALGDLVCRERQPRVGP